MDLGANGEGGREATNLEKTIGTLKRCLEIAGTSNKPGNRSAKNSISEDFVSSLISFNPLS